MNRALPSYPLRAVHLTAVWAYAVSQPVFSLLEGNPEFLAVRGLTRAEVILFAVSLTVGPPLFAVACEWLVSRVSRWAANVLHVLFLIVFLVPLALQITKWLDPSTPDVALLIVLLVSMGGAAAYLMSRPVRLFLGFSLVLPIIGLVSFVFGVPVATDDAEAAAVRGASHPPIVMLVLDELPVSSLMTRSGDIDAVRYPNFARLSRDGTWYRNATTVHEGTLAAVPAILTGRVPRTDELPILADHPRNLFTLLDATYALRVREGWTRLCPLSRCPLTEGSILQRVDDLSEDLGIAFLHRVVPHSMIAPVPPTFTGHEGEAFEGFLSHVAADREPGVLHFIHMLLPHAPWRYLPSGRTYGFSESIEGLRLTDGAWIDDSWLVEQAYQRHLLQVGYTDTLVGRLLRELERDGLYDRALVILVADHGASFRPGGVRRSVNRANLADIAGVPMIVKYPNQRSGAVDSRVARTIDLLPTIAEVLGIRLPWRADGRSLLEAPSRRRAVVVRSHEGVVIAAATEVMRDIEATVNRKAALFGEGQDSLYRIGTNRRLLGSRVTSTLHRSTTVRVRIQDDEQLADVRSGSSSIPSRIAGVVDSGQLRSGTELAIAVNGRLVALARCFWASGRQWFRSLVPESSLKEGYNRIDIFAVENDDSRHRLVWLGAGPSRP